MLIVGSPVSPYVRKVLIVLHLKGLEYEIDPITPFYGNDEFSRLSPLRRIPLLINGDLVVNDSTAIAEYLDETFPNPGVMPDGPENRARARWIEEYADSRLGDLCIWSYFFPKFVAPRVFQREPDLALIARTETEDLPAALDWLEGQAPEADFLFGAAVATADIAVACVLRNAAIAGWTPDAVRWPKAAAWIDRVQALPAFQRTLTMEPAILATPLEQRNAALAAAGVKVSATSFAEQSPRDSIMLR